MEFIIGNCQGLEHSRLRLRWEVTVVFTYL